MTPRCTFTQQQQQGLRQPALSLSAAYNNEHDPTDEADPTQYWREGNGLLAVSTNLEWAGIDDLLALGVGDPAKREGNNTDDNKNYADDACRLHRSYSVRLPPMRLMIRMTTAITSRM